MLRVKGNVTTEIGERYYGLRPPDFPLPFRIFGHLPAHGSKLGQRLGAERTPFMREGSCREAVGTPQGATLLDRGAISHE